MKPATREAYSSVNTSVTRVGGGGYTNGNSGANVNYPVNEQPAQDAGTTRTNYSFFPDRLPGQMDAGLESEVSKAMSRIRESVFSDLEEFDSILGSLVLDEVEPQWILDKIASDVDLNTILKSVESEHGIQGVRELLSQGVQLAIENQDYLKAFLYSGLQSDYPLDEHSEPSSIAESSKRNERMLTAKQIVESSKTKPVVLTAKQIVESSKIKVKPVALTAKQIAEASKGGYEVYGVKGMNSKPFHKNFKTDAARQAWLDKNEGDIEVHGFRDPEEAKTESVKTKLEEGSTVAGLFPGVYVSIKERKSGKRVDGGIVTKMSRTSIFVANEEYDQKDYQFIRLA